MLKLKFFTDPGHGWLEVPYEGIRPDVRNQISSCSYYHNGMAYLEEDCDAPLYLNNLKEKPEFIEIFQENTPIRGYAPFRG